MARRREGPSLFPPHLATFDPDAWPPAPGELEERCCCGSYCLERFGPPKPATNTVWDAHRRWREARAAVLMKGTSEYRAEVLEALRDTRIRRIDQRREEGTTDAYHRDH